MPEGVLWMALGVVGLIAFLGVLSDPALTSEKIDNVCDDDGAYLVRVGGVWVCEMMSFAEGFYHSYDTPIVVDLVTENVYVNITGFALNDTYQIDTLGNAIRINHDSYYLINGMMSYSGGNSGEYEVELFVNDVGQEDCVFFTSTSNVDKDTGGFSCILRLFYGDTLVVKVKDISAPVQDFSIYQLNFNIVEII